MFCFEGFNPSWNENFQFDVYVPELALVRFSIEDYDSSSDNDFVGQYTIPFNSLKMGEFFCICQVLFFSSYYNPVL